MLNRYQLHKALPIIAGPVALILAWALLATAVGSDSLAGPSSVLSTIVSSSDGGDLLSACAATVLRAGEGLAIAVLLAAAATLLVYSTPLVRPFVASMGVGINALPIIAIGPFLVATIGPDKAAVGTATQASFFVLFVAFSAGLDAPGQAETDLFRALGAGPLQRLGRLNIPSAIPLALDGIKVAVTAALLGAIIGEWFGAGHGLGILLLSAMTNVQIPLMWSAAVVAGSVSLLAYAAASLLSRTAHRRYPRPATSARALAAGPLWQQSPMWRFASPVLTFVLLLVAWQLYVTVSGTPALVLPTPVKTIDYLSHHASTYLQASAHTLGVAAVGLALGTFLGGGVAIAMARWHSISAGVMPVALIVPSIPIVVVIPLLALLVGYNETAVIGVTVLTSFFPALVFTRAGLEALPPGSDDVLRSLGATSGRRTRLLQLPASVPNALVGLRFSAGACLLSALTAEWLIGNNGLGWIYGQGAGLDNVYEQWAAIILMIALAMLIYELATILAELGHRRFA